jgi:hypothetical protein
MHCNGFLVSKQMDILDRNMTALTVFMEEKKLKEIKCSDCWPVYSGKYPPKQPNGKLAEFLYENMYLMATLKTFYINPAFSRTLTLRTHGKKLWWRKMINVSTFWRTALHVSKLWYALTWMVVDKPSSACIYGN